MAVSIEDLYAHFLEHPSLSTDSRNIVPNSLFFALKGDRFDANTFASSALEQGCAMAVVDDPNVAVDERYLIVENVLLSLQNLAAFHRKKMKIPIIGITGTNGKTTTKELIRSVLSTQFKTHATQGNLNNHIGVPLTLLSTPKNTELLIVEMGANHPGEIADLCKIAQPDLGLITNIGKAHLEGFESFENIVETKTALYLSVKNNNGTVWVNRQIPELMLHSKNQKRIIYGIEDAHSLENSDLPNDFVSFTYKSQPIHTQLFGEYNLNNILAACSVGEYFGISIPNIKKGLENYTPTNNRSQLLKTAKNTLILDAYNANPTSMEAALRSFAKIRAPKKFFVLGDMLELGSNSPAEHLQIIELLQKLNLTQGCFVGKIFHSVCKNELTFEHIDQARYFLYKQSFTNYTFLIKGSRGIHLETLIDVLR